MIWFEFRLRLRFMTGLFEHVEQVPDRPTGPLFNMSYWHHTPKAYVIEDFGVFQQTDFAGGASSFRLLGPSR